MRSFRKISQAKLSMSPRKAIIDIGAWEPRADSVSLLFIEQGWESILVEPQETYFLKNSEYHKSNLKVRVRNTAVSDQIGKSFIFVPEITTGWTSLDEQHSMKMGEQLLRIECGVTTLNELHKEVMEPYWILKIDAEGSEEKIIRGWTDLNINPILILIEGRNQSVVELLVQKGYKLYFYDGINSYFVLFDLFPLLEEFFPINVNDDGMFRLAENSWLTNSVKLD